MARLSLTNISKIYNGARVVDKLSLEIEPGEFVSLLGPSGCGKSTILRMIAGFEQVDEGQIHHGGNCLSSTQIHVPTEERNFGMVFQSYALWPHMTVEQNIAYPLKIKKIKGEQRTKKVIEALEIVQLNDYAKRYPNQLSGGQRQRVALARSLVCEPEIILLDEPLANLDRHLRESMEITFREFHKRTGATLIYVTHDQTEAMALSDRIAVIKAGKILQWSTPQDIYNKPNTTWIADFIGKGSITNANLTTLKKSLLNEEEIHGAINSHIGNPSHDYKLLIRPQHIAIHDSASAYSLPAIATECLYKGDKYEVFFELSSNDRILAFSDHPISKGTTKHIILKSAWPLEI
ncbi:ABC transporter ATP-binding protein [Salinispirillum marinum]|uniref:ABC transporter ATP-binding protein n=2 Tax=Saccharospirillaceae TaxID=255527 RepID=A0ABV8BCW3_9GAMM